MQYGNLIIQIRNLGLIIVFGARLFDLCLRLVQLRLTQLDNRTESESVPLLRKVHSQIGVVEFLPQRPRSLPFAVLYAIRAGSDRVLWVTARRGRRLQPKGRSVLPPGAPGNSRPSKGGSPRAVFRYRAWYETRSHHRVTRQCFGLSFVNRL